MNAYRLAILCGAVPLALGVLTFASWLATGWRELMMAGLIVLYLGFAAFIIGVMAVTRFLIAARESGQVSFKKARRKALAASALLLANFPAAAAIIFAVGLLETTYSVTVVNASGGAVDEVRLFGGGRDVSLGSIAAGGRSRARLRFREDGVLEIQVFRGTASETEMIVGYVSPGQGGRMTVIIEADGVRVDVPDR
jgi:hypothetical protein